MHKFLRTIGFSIIEKKDLELIIEKIIKSPEIIKVARNSEGNEFAELSVSFAPNIGITVCGTYQEDDSFEMEYYYPYVNGSGLTTNEQIDVERHSEKESYAGVCDDLNLGVTLIFYLQNVTDYLLDHNKHLSKNYYGAKLAGLSIDGKILCPVLENAPKERAGIYNSEQHNQLVAQARDGDEDAIESLTLEDMDTYALLSQRILKEDVFTIVKTSFMPYGVESDHYAVLGEIVEFVRMDNKITHEAVYKMQLNCNNILFDVCINEKDLLGEPAVGRRFKGCVWMQGSICLE